MVPPCGLKALQEIDTMPKRQYKDYVITLEGPRLLIHTKGGTALGIATSLSEAEGFAEADLWRLSCLHRKYP